MAHSIGLLVLPPIAIIAEQRVSRQFSLSVLNGSLTQKKFQSNWNPDQWMFQNPTDIFSKKRTIITQEAFEVVLSEMKKNKQGNS